MFGDDWWREGAKEQNLFFTYCQEMVIFLREMLRNKPTNLLEMKEGTRNGVN